MASRQTIRVRLGEYLEHVRPALVSEREWAELRERLAPVSDDYLRRLLRESGAPLAPLVEGIRQDSFDQLERTLAALGGEYEKAAAQGNRDRARACRRLVISAKDHARLVARRAATSAEKRADKEEMALWMLTWLENPGVFAEWLALRKRARAAAP